MKKIALLLILLTAFVAKAQTDGLSYQAVIIDPNEQELPGVNATGNILPNADVTLRFTILNESGNVEYKETQDTRTDAYGMVNLIIGQGNALTANRFTDIFWGGSRKDLQVEVKLYGQYADLGKNKLTFVPYAYHRDIIATGYFALDGPATLGDSLEVEGMTDLNGSLSVNNESPTNLTGTLSVDGQTDLNNTVNINNGSELNASGNVNVVGDTQLDSNLTVDGITNLNSDLNVNNNSATVLTGTLRVDGQTDLNGDVNINNGSALNVSGPLNVEGITTLGDDLIVEGTTNLNNSLDVNNNSPSRLSGTLTVEGETLLENSLTVNGATNLESFFNVNNQSPSILSGSLTVDLDTNLNSSLSVNNGSPTFLSGPLNVDGPIGLNNNLTVNGVTNLNGSLFVNNIAPTNLTGSLFVGGPANMDGTLIVNGETTLNQGLTVANASETNLTGQLNVDGETFLNNSLNVLNASPTNLTGNLTVDGETTLNNSLEVANNTPTMLTGTLEVGEATTLQNELSVLNGSSTVLTGTLTVDNETTLNSSLTVANGSPTQLTGILDVTGATTLNDILTVGGATTINNDLTVTGNTFLSSLNTQTINIESDNTNYIASFVNTNSATGDGIVIKLGKNHGALNGGTVYNYPNPIQSDLQGPLNALKARIQNAGGGPITFSEVIAFAPAAQRIATFNYVNNLIFSEINTRSISGTSGGLTLPIAFPNLTVPGTTLLNGYNVFGGVNIPFVNISIPSWSIPTIPLPNIPIPIPSAQIPNPAQYIPSLPINLPVGDLPFVVLPADIIVNYLPATAGDVSPDSLTKENEYITFQDKDGRKTGTIRAQSLWDFKENTMLDNIYMLNLLSDFVGIDLLDGITAGTVSITNFIDEFNKIGVEYSSGNGDYAEWLERMDASEYITAGDIVAVVGGKVTRNLENAEQVMVVSHRPIILGNAPEEGQEPLGNNIAFMGQVPVKVLGPVSTGDYIVADKNIIGYGKAMAPNEMTAQDFKYAVGRSWEENLKEGPKLVNTVVGVHNGDWIQIVQKLQKKQELYEDKFKKIEAQVIELDNKANELLLENK